MSVCYQFRDPPDGEWTSCEQNQVPALRKAGMETRAVKIDDADTPDAETAAAWLDLLGDQIDSRRLVGVDIDRHATLIDFLERRTTRRKAHPDDDPDYGNRS